MKELHTSRNSRIGRYMIHEGINRRGNYERIEVVKE
jgi:hypothetical protein